MSAIMEIKELWISTKDRIASFHEEAGYEKITFSDVNHFLSYLQELSDSGYRFM